MRITIFGASGMVGKQVIKKALALGHTVKAFGRNITGMIDADLRNENFEAVKGYVFDEDDVFTAVKDSDAVISVLGGAADGSDQTRSLGMKNIVAQMQKASVNRIVALGNIAVLNADEEGHLLIDDPEYPVQYIPVGQEHVKAYETLKGSNLDWTFVCAPDIIDADGNGMYYTKANFPPVPNSNKINSGNLALFMVNEATKNDYVKQRVGITNI